MTQPPGAFPGTQETWILKSKIPQHSINIICFKTQSPRIYTDNLCISVYGFHPLTELKEH